MARRGKYNVAPKSKRTLKGTVYMSKLEMDYRKYLDLLVKAKEVVSIEEQVPFKCEVNGCLVCKYVLDFKVTYSSGVIEYVDVKGISTSVFTLKKKLVEALFPIKIKIVKKGDFKI